MEHKPTAQARLMIWQLNDDDDGNDDQRRNETLVSLRQLHDAAFSLPPVSSQSSFASWTVLTYPDEELPFKCCFQENGNGIFLASIVFGYPPSQFFLAALPQQASPLGSHQDLCLLATSSQQASRFGDKGKQASPLYIHKTHLGKLPNPVT